ncbi:MAG: ATP-binding protein [Candidatus Paceibacterota bacterium]
MAREYINAYPRKELFINILTQDVSVKAAILDLIDNSVDSYTRNQYKERREVKIILNKEVFLIFDTCGGIDKEFLKEDVFRFGSKKINKKHPTLGMYGIGLKRSIFKLGNNIKFETDDGNFNSIMNLKVDDWNRDEKIWNIPFDAYPSTLSKADKAFTKIEIKQLYEEIQSKFELDSFQEDLYETIKRVYSLIIKDNIDFYFNERKIEAYELLVPQDEDYSPAVFIDEYEGVNIKIICFIDPSKGTRRQNTINKVGWNYYCNDRLILANDTSEITGWAGASDASLLPKYHTIYNDFRGLVFLNSTDPFKLPLNTSKSGLNTENRVYNYVLNKMVNTARPVIDYISKKYDKQKKEEEDLEKELQNDIDEAYNPKEFKVNLLKERSEFRAPIKLKKEKGPSMATISYKKERNKVKKVKKALKVNSNKEVGKKTFDYFVQMEGLTDE